LFFSEEETERIIGGQLNQSAGNISSDSPETEMTSKKRNRKRDSSNKISIEEMRAAGTRKMRK
jgi:hypothetical protein